MGLIPSAAPRVTGTLVCLLSLLSARAGAQVPAADSAFAAGRLGEARRLYLQVLQSHPRNVRALYRLGVLASWDGKLDSALVLLRRARAEQPADPDLMNAEARVLSWAGNYDAAVHLYDSLLAAHPGNAEAAMGKARTLAWANQLGRADSAFASILARDPYNEEARVGRAQAASWRGDFATAVRGYRLTLERDSGNVAARNGLSQVYLWQGRYFDARREIRRAWALDSNNHDTRLIRGRIGAAIRPKFSATAAWSRDSDHNTNWWQTMAISLALANRLRGFAQSGLLEASDPIRHAHRASGEAGLSWAPGNMHLTVAGGARRLAPDGAPTRTEATYRASMGYRFGPTGGIGVGFTHYPFDETALLIGRNLNLDDASVSGDWTVLHGLTLSAGGSRTWFSDDNTRNAGVMALTQTVRRRFFIGAFGRMMGYDFKGFGYFSPDRFALLEGRGGYVYQSATWTARLTGGLGVQQISRGGASQSAWHIEGRLGRAWGAANAIEAFGGITNSAASSTTGAFRYGTAGITIRLGL